MEFGECVEECARRETKEETNLDIQGIKMLGVINCVRPELNYHYVIFYVSATLVQGDQLKNMEPGKCHEWRWFPFEEIQMLEPLFFPLEQYLTDIGTNPLMDKQTT
eukprot:TRINITY_DN9427_c0_g1_i2.p1 TRINITY_DN9427_c0_g1~~TRINITY_DN9427_c0_g1_i2.p1  ORF type:complete len:106 (-),score=14.40 TRINITY_DN9427_c0_g1_i2:163-480(-)